MKKIIRLTESDLTRIVRRVISEQTSPVDPISKSELISVTRNKGGSTAALKTPSGRMSFNRCQPGQTNDCFEHPSLLSAGTHTLGSTDCKNCDFMFLSKNGTEYLCRFTTPCKKI